MALDYSDGCINLRDVGEFINLIAQKKVLPIGKILRGGSIDCVKDWAAVYSPQTVINLRNGHDPTDFDFDYLHFPMSNKIEKYDTTQKEVRIWLNDIMQTFENKELKFPVLIHCLSGKDRTGIVIAALLKILNIPDKWIIEEYLLSDGEVKEEWIQ